MREPLDEMYLVWLYSQVGNVKVKSARRSYWNLLRQMYQTEFIWLVPNDDARAADGIELRHEFMYDAEIPEVPDEWLRLGCSFLEMMIGICRRLSFDTGDPVDAWFWHLLYNLGLHECNDAAGDITTQVELALNKVIWRTYRHNGEGGLFPLRKPDKDQTKVELWYQFCAYVIENE